MIAESAARRTPDVSGEPGARRRAHGVIPAQRRATSDTAPPGRRSPRHGRRARSRQAPTGPPDLAQTARDAVVRYLRDATEAAAGTEPVVTAPPIPAADTAAPTASARLPPSHPHTALEALAALSQPTPSITEFSSAPETSAPETSAPETSAPEGAARLDTTGTTDPPGPTDAALSPPDTSPVARTGYQAPASATAAAAPETAASVAVRAAAASVATLDKMEAMAAKLETDIAVALRRQAELQAGAGAAAEAAVQAAQNAWLAAGTSVEAERHVRLHLRVISRDMMITAALVLAGLIILLLFATSAH